MKEANDGSTSDELGVRVLAVVPVYLNLEL